MYAEQVRLVQGDSNLSNVYGIKENSTLNDLNNYHVINGMPPDLAHDNFEGVICDVMTIVIKHCVTEGYFSLENLNEQIKLFKFSEVDKGNKPSKVNQTLRKFSVKQSAAQNWCLVRHLPILVGDSIPLHDEKWECLLRLLDMLFYVCAPAFDRGHILVMADVIEEFHESYRSCFPELSVKPIFHYTLHYLHLISLFGPLCQLQTLRFEGKHNYFNELVFRTKNRQNMCKSLAERHQYYQCTFNTGNSFLSDQRVESSKGKTVPLCLLNDDIQQLLTGILYGNEIFLCDSVKYCGITYFRGSCIVTDVQGALFQFSKIVDCAIIHGFPHLLCTKLSTSRFDRHYYAFIVSDTNECEIHRVSNLIEPNPLGIYDDPRNQIVKKNW